MAKCKINWLMDNILQKHIVVTEQIIESLTIKTEKL